MDVVFEHCFILAKGIAAYMTVLCVPNYRIHTPNGMLLSQNNPVRMTKNNISARRF